MFDSHTYSPEIETPVPIILEEDKIIDGTYIKGGTIHDALNYLSGKGLRPLTLEEVILQQVRKNDIYAHNSSGDLREVLSSTVYLDSSTQVWWDGEAHKLKFRKSPLSSDDVICNLPVNSDLVNESNINEFIWRSSALVSPQLADIYRRIPKRSDPSNQHRFIVPTSYWNSQAKGSSGILTLFLNTGNIACSLTSKLRTRYNIGDQASILAVPIEDN